MDGGSEQGQWLDALYVAVRDDTAVDRQAAFDAAMNELEYYPLSAEARELAEASTADGGETRLASAAAAFLDAYGYEPGFEQAPGRFARLERALDTVRADMRATGLTGEVRLVEAANCTGPACRLPSRILGGRRRRLWPAADPAQEPEGAITQIGFSEQGSAHDRDRDRNRHEQFDDANDLTQSGVQHPDAARNPKNDHARRN